MPRVPASTPLPCDAPEDSDPSRRACARHVVAVQVRTILAGGGIGRHPNRRGHHCRGCDRCMGTPSPYALQRGIFNTPPTSCSPCPDGRHVVIEVTTAAGEGLAPYPLLASAGNPAHYRGNGDSYRSRVLGSNAH
jgi:hypothetical protein